MQFARLAIVSLKDFSLDHTSTFWADYAEGYSGKLFIATIMLESECDKRVSTQAREAFYF